MSKILDDLATDLAINQAKMSLLKEEFSSIDCLSEILNIDIDSKKLPTRNILVVGAGCSASAYHNLLPLGNKSIDLLEQHFSMGKLSKKMRDKADEIMLKTNLPQIVGLNDFETKLTVLSHFFTNSEIRKALNKLFGYKTFPNLFYELIAHLLKNRFIECIINFNFDELLDQTIDEEVGQGQLHRILSDGDCLPYEAMLINDRLKVPVYIKPHGTISHKSSLRFTKEQYVDIPFDIEILLEELLSGRVLNKSEDSHKIPQQFGDLNLIIAGFNMESIEFNQLLERSVKHLISEDRNVNIIYLNRDISERKEVEDNLKKLFQFSIKENFENLRFKIENLNHELNYDYGLGQYLKNRPLDKFALELTKKIGEKFKPEYAPKKVLRHIGLILFFKNRIREIERTKPFSKFTNNTKSFIKQRNNLFFNTKNYYLERTIFEITIVILKNKGYIQPKESLKKDNRIGNYFNMYIERHRMNRFSRKTIAEELSFYDILELLGLKSELNPSMKELFHLPFKHEFDEYRKLNFNKFMNKWISLLKKQHSQISSDNRKQELRETCIKSLGRFKRIFSSLKENNSVSAGDSIIHSSSINLYPDYKDIQLNFIAKLHSTNIIPTNLAMKYRSRSMFISSKPWNRLHIVSDRGLTLLNYLKEIKSINFSFLEQKKIYLVVSNELAVSEILRLSKKINNLNVKIFVLPYYDHNRHMILFDSDNLKHTRLIYYYKKGFSNNINPVYLEGSSNKNNLNMMFNFFKIYIAKAIYYDRHKEKPINSIPFFKDMDSIETIIETYPSILDKNDKRHFLTFKKI